MKDFLILNDQINKMPHNLTSLSIEDLLKHLIILESQNVPTSSAITYIINEVFNDKSKKVLTLFYHYISLIPKTCEGKVLAEVLLLTNQIRKDMLSVNHFTRIKAMRVIPEFIGLSVMGTFYPALKENLCHKHPIVRRSAIDIATRLFYSSSLYDEVFILLIKMFNKEDDRFVRRELLKKYFGFKPKYFLKEDKIILILIKNDIRILETVEEEQEISKSDKKESDILEEYRIEINTTEEHIMVLEVIIELCNDKEILLKCFERSSFLAGLKIMNLYPEIKENEKIISIILSDVRKSEALYELLNMDIDPLIFSIHIDKLINCFNKKFYSNKYFDLLFLSAQTENDFLKINDFLLKNLESSSSADDKVFMIKIINEYMQNFGITDERINILISKSVNNISPSISYESLKFLKEKGNQIFLELEKIKYGKIFRKALEICDERIQNLNEILKLIETFETNFNNKNIVNDRIPILKSLWSTNTPFIGDILALFFESLSRKFDFSDELKGRIIALLLKFIYLGVKTNKMDKSTYLTMKMCIQNIQNSSKITENHDSGALNNYIKVNYLKGSIFDPYKFGKVESKLNETQNITRNGNNKFIKPISAISDPLYVEATIEILHSDVIMNLEITNQTDSLFQNIKIELISSESIHFHSGDLIITSLKSNEVKNTRFVFKMYECGDAFIYGNISFNYPGKQREYAGSIYNMNLDTIDFMIKDFLIKKQIEPNDFREKWIKQEWENTYSVKLTTRNIVAIRNKIMESLKGTLVTEEGDDQFLVSNISLGSVLENEIFMNIVIVCKNSTDIECRIRSSSENIVKSISKSMSNTIKSAAS